MLNRETPTICVIPAENNPEKVFPPDGVSGENRNDPTYGHKLVMKLYSITSAKTRLISGF
jgi:hypothetical protein